MVKAFFCYFPLIIMQPSTKLTALYFAPHQGEQKLICTSFNVESLQTIYENIVKELAPGIQEMLLVKEDSRKHKKIRKSSQSCYLLKEIPYTE